MERLTSYKNETSREMICRYEDCDVCEEYCPHMQEDNCSCLQEVLEKLGQYEDAEEQGLLLRLPCKVGTEVYVIGEECEGDPYDCHHCCDSCACNVLDVYLEKFDVWMLDDFGVSVFLTKEEAEQKLANMQKGEKDE